MKFYYLIPTRNSFVVLTAVTLLLNPLLGISKNFRGHSADSLPGDSITLPLWPTVVPNEQDTLGLEKDSTQPDDNLVAGRRVIRLINVSQPAITVYHPPAERSTGTAVVVCPGGGYYVLAMDLEGTEVCQWLNSLGITAILLKYRVPRRNNLPKHVAPLQDAQRAMGLVRQHARAWSIDPERVGMIGFSAGGHLTATLSNNYRQRTYEPIDSADYLNCRPNFSMLIYPAYLMDKEDSTQLSAELPVNKSTPPTFIVQTADDGIGVENSLLYYLKLKQAGVPAEMHLYATGGHGYGLRSIESNVSTWPIQAERWLQTIGVLTQ
ncbi:alpha/beta hydrolase [Tunicatimonas pelagia]|uniref:alpha/beta hydrolase n=1 Tax=Tunicatimonas pelagia TaxID=931531 RepID=UPI0026657CEC|nr:alpha/beta hydrolase [Tunicatimonas pelagia]WKN44203.1 alpha/beta hydrolase [Tunicatimonas pelagia]